MKTRIICAEEDCIVRGEYSNCYILGTEMCKFYGKLKDVKPIDLRLSQNGSLEIKAEEIAR